MTYKVTYTRTNKDGVAVTNTTNIESISNRPEDIIRAFFQSSSIIFPFSETFNLSIDKIEAAQGAPETVTDFRKQVEGAYTISVVATLHNGRKDSKELFSGEATSGADAVAKMWENIKGTAMGALFCDGAGSRAISTELAVKVLPSGTGTVWERSATKSGVTTEHAGHTVTVNGDSVTISGPITKENAEKLRQVLTGEAICNGIWYVAGELARSNATDSHRGATISRNGDEFQLDATITRREATQLRELLGRQTYPNNYELLQVLRAGLGA